MIFFVGNGGTIVKGLPEPVYQGAANANTVYLVAPFASNGTVTVAFQLPNGTATSPAQMTAQGEISGITDENGNAYSGWLYDLPNAVTALYGVVTAQFYFYNAQGKITASSATSFTVGRGVPAVLPAEPSEDVYEQILSNIAALQTDLNNGFYAARAIYAWNSTYTYGANEITYYPVGTYGAFVKSVVANNIGQTPYVDGAVNSAYWAEVLNFDNAYAAMQASVDAAQEAASHAENQADAAAQSASDAEQSAGQAEFYAGDASASAANALASETAAGESATAAAGSAGEAADSASDAEQSAENAAASAELARKYAELGIQPNTDYTSVDDLPKPGSTKFIYLIPAEGAGSSGDDVYDEYIWVPDKNDYEHIGSTRIDLSNYAQINGNYQGMTVGAATKATQDGNGDVISDTYAKKNDIGLVQQIDEPLPVPTEENPYVIYDDVDKSAYVRKFYQTQENTIYPPSSDYVYYLVLHGLSGASFSGRYKIVWANSAGVTFLRSNYSALISGALYISSNDYSSVNEAEAALKTSVTEYTQATSLIYFSRNSSSATVSFPVVNSNINSTVRYPSSYRRRQNGVVYEFTWSYSDADPYNPFSGYVDGTAPQSQYVKIIDADDAQNYATKKEVAAKYTKPATGIPESDLAEEVRGKLFNPEGTYESLTSGKAIADGNGNNIADTYATKTSVNAKYTKPSGGIPETDLAQAVRDTLDESISESEVVPYLDALPATVDANSPSFVSVNGVLYQKKYEVTPADNTKLEGVWSSNTSVISGIASFDSGISSTPIGNFGVTPIYGSRYSSDQLWFDDDPSHSTGVRGFSVVDTDDGLWFMPGDVTFNAYADTFDSSNKILGAMQHFYTKKNSENYSYEEVGGNEFNPNGTYSGLTAGKATNDGNGDNIANTYVKKSAVKYQHNMLLTKTDETSVVFSVLLPSAAVYTSITQFCSDMFASYGVQMVNASGYWSGNNVITSFWASSASTFGTNYEGGTSASQAASSYTIETDHVVALTT